MKLLRGCFPGDKVHCTFPKRLCYTFWTLPTDQVCFNFNDLEELDHRLLNSILGRKKSSLKINGPLGLFRCEKILLAIMFSVLHTSDLSVFQVFWPLCTQQGCVYVLMCTCVCVPMDACAHRSIAAHLNGKNATTKIQSVVLMGNWLNCICLKY